jgi:MMP 1-O-methyltransferase
MKNDDKFILGKTSGIDGWLTEKEILFLYDAAKNGPGSGAVVEIGSWKGRSTVALALGLKAGNRKEKVYAIDWHRGSKENGTVNTLPEFKKNIKSSGGSEYVKPMIMKSEDAAKLWSRKPKPIRLLWVDGSHEYEDVKKDFDLWSPFLESGGIIAFHDTFYWPGPKKVVHDGVFGGNFSGIGFADNITFARKAGKKTLENRLENSCKLALKKAMYVKKRAFGLLPI